MEGDKMKNLINKLNKNTKMIIKDVEYLVKTKTWYTIEEDNTVSYVKCELSNNKALVIIPDDNFMYIGEVIKDMKYDVLSDDKIKYNNMIFNKTGSGHQYITKIEFGDTDEVEGKCIFEDYEAEDYIISLGILPDEGNIRADVFANIIDLEDIYIK